MARNGSEGVEMGVRLYWYEHQMVKRLLTVP